MNPEPEQPDRPAPADDRPQAPPAPLPRLPAADALLARHPEWQTDPEPTAPTGSSDASWPPARSAPVTVLVPTLNEAADLPGCLRRLRWAEQVLVIDSGSTDDTPAIAQALGADVIRFDYAHHSPTGWPKKRNWALDHAPIRHGWVLLIDADEHAVPALARQVADVVTGRARPRRPGDGAAYWLNRRFMFRGRWVRYGGYYPAWNLRLFKRDAGRFERVTDAGDTRSGDMEVHEHVKLTPDAGTAGYLDHDLLHYEIADFAEWVEKHNRYSSWEAAVARTDLDDGSSAGIRPDFRGTPQQRRRWLKRAARRLPCRPTLRFWYHFGLRQGFREGRLGLHLARLLAAYEAMTLAKADTPPPPPPEVAPPPEATEIDATR